MQSNLLNEACLVLEILDIPGSPKYFTVNNENRRELINWYCDLQLKEYCSIFRNNPEVCPIFF